MRISTVNDCKILDLKNQINNITIRNNNEIPFEIRRIYYLYNIRDKSIRGEHAHKGLNQVIIGLNKGLKIKIDDGHNEKIFNLRNSNKGLLIVPGIWRTLTEFHPDSVCLVLSSELYDERDYIRDYNEFLNFKK